MFRVTIDDQPSETGTLFDSFSSPGRFFISKSFYSKLLADTEHHVRLELLETKIDKTAARTLSLRIYHCWRTPAVIPGMASELP